jgi:hypothetical protein
MSNAEKAHFHAQRDKIYPHIEKHDAQYGINAAWLRCLTDANFKFSKWASKKAVRVNVVSVLPPVLDEC